MPAIIGSIQLVNIGGGVVNFGDTLNIAPKTTTKQNQGSGSGNVGGFTITNNGFSATNSVDPDLIDQPATQNN
ncbi:spore germination protein [Bacillus andreraoultii]|uniref:spore germination protein n=1 Tax=Bacillus andreraoultii TaxID=1499685 RepID=UPI00053B3BC3|nr:spore germination protein [Bacillus andreraoultii]